MQIAISIPDKYVSPDKSILDIINEMVENGLKIDCTILPKGHDRLIEAKRLKEVFRRNTGYDYHDLIDNAPTIIEAEVDVDDD